MGRHQEEYRPLNSSKGSEREFLLSSAFKAVPHIVVVIGTDYRVRLMNDAAREYFGIDEPSDDLSCHKVFGRNETPCSERGLACKMHEARECGRPIKVSIQRKDGRPYEQENRFIELMVSPYYEDEGSFAGIVVTGTDVSEHKSVEVELRSLLEKRETLLREIHHRVKNNLMVVSSLLMLQSRHVSDPDAVEKFKESANRIRSMSLVHEKLYRSTGFDEINMGEYLQNLAVQSYLSYEVDHSSVDLKIEADDIPLQTGQAIPCGLIMNELLSNSLKHAFSDGNKGEIRVVFHESPENTYTLSVRDTGACLPEGFDAYSTRTLGMQIITSLANQLNGKVEVLSSSGATEFRIEFSPR